MKDVDTAKIGMEPMSNLDHRQRMIVAGYVHSEGFIILQRLMEDELKLLNQNLINTNQADKDAIVANFMLVKSAGMFYAGVIQRIKEEVTLAGNEASTIGTIGDPERPFYPAEFDGQDIV